MPSALSYLFFLCLLLYTQFIFSARARKRAMQAETPIAYVVPRWNSYLSIILISAFQAGIALLIGLLNGVQIFGSRRFELETVLLSIAFLVLNIAFVDPAEWKYASTKVKNGIIAFLPHNGKERLIWGPVSLATAVSEEIVYRAVFFGLFYRLTGDYWAAGIFSAILFAFSHRGYGLSAVGSTFFVGLVLQWFVLISGGLYISIAVHFLHNFFALVYALREKQEIPATSQLEKTSEAAPGLE